MLCMTLYVAIASSKVPFSIHRSCENVFACKPACTKTVNVSVDCYSTVPVCKTPPSRLYVKQTIDRDRGSADVVRIDVHTPSLANAFPESNMLRTVITVEHSLSPRGMQSELPRKSHMVSLTPRGRCRERVD